TAKTDEMNQIAALYLNRLKAQMPLQADPTVKFAVGDFALRRILKEHLTIDSPYNTYKNTGLPPGPIRIPSKVAIDAVLNPAEHNYLFMCAKEDLSGYHNFAVTYEEHLINAHKYQDELDRRNIK
ncbi:MAG TPA: endolytic transglycosylase MltG, partial [Chitinophagales bacterium]|nr:endolytic transglycosylase MltG [Chitinophagales bacterium]